MVHGIDLVEISRVAELLERHGERFRERCFTEGEQSDADAGGAGRIARYAARFAMKEAVLKALGTGWSGGIEWTDVETRRAPSGQPILTLHGAAAERAAELGIRSWAVSMSHTGDLAMASAIGGA